MTFGIAVVVYGPLALVAGRLPKSVREKIHWFFVALLGLVPMAFLLFITIAILSAAYRFVVSHF